MSATDPIPRSPPILDEPPKSACSQKQTITPCRNWKDYSQEYNGAFWTALKLQLGLAVVTALVLDGGQMHRAFWIAFVGQWVAAWIIVFRRPMNPTRTDLAVVRYGIIPLLVIVVSFGPGLLRLLSIQQNPTAIRQELRAIAEPATPPPVVAVPEDPKRADPWPDRADDGLLTLNLTVRLPDGSPAAGASVVSLTQRLGQVQSARADAVGRVTIRAIFGQGARIHASSADGNHQATWKSTAPEVRTALAKPVELILAPAVDHQVTVTSDERPVADAQVVAQGHYFMVTGATGRDGVANLKLPADDRLNEVSTWHAEFGVAGVWQLGEKPPQTKTTLSLRTPAPLTIRVVDAHDKAVPELDICVSSVIVEEQDDFKEREAILTQGFGAAKVRTNEQGETSIPWPPRDKLAYVGVDLMDANWTIDALDGQGRRIKSVRFPAP